MDADIDFAEPKELRISRKDNDDNQTYKLVDCTYDEVIMMVALWPLIVQRVLS